MAAVKCEITRCGLCRFYSHEGRRGGTCSQLNVNVDSHWSACALASAPFVKSEKVVEIAEWVTPEPLSQPVVEAPVLPIARQPIVRQPTDTSLSTATA